MIYGIIFSLIVGLSIFIILSFNIRVTGKGQKYKVPYSSEIYTVEAIYSPNDYINYFSEKETFKNNKVHNSFYIINKEYKGVHSQKDAKRHFWFH
jgi:hypothetical protein